MWKKVRCLKILNFAAITGRVKSDKNHKFRSNLGGSSDEEEEVYIVFKSFPR